MSKAGSTTQAQPRRVEVPVQHKLLVARYSPCVERVLGSKGTQEQCKCKGFALQYRPTADSKQSDLCSSCKHKLHLHGMGTMPLVEFNKRLGIAQSIQQLLEQNMKLKSNSAEAQANNKKVEALKNQLKTPPPSTLLNQDPAKAAEIRKKEEQFMVYLGKPPFEQPTLRTAMKNFLALKYFARMSREQMSNIEKVCNHFLTIMNDLELIEPKKHAEEYGASQTYQHNYFRWQVYCRGRSGQTIRGLRLPVFDLFGRQFLISVFPLVKNAFDTRLKGKLEPVKDLVVMFFKDLQAEMDDENSVVFQVEFGRRLETMRQQQQRLGTRPEDGIRQIEEAAAATKRRKVETDKANAAVQKAATTGPAAQQAAKIASEKQLKKYWTKLGATAGTGNGGYDIMVIGHFQKNMRYRCFFASNSETVQSDFVAPTSVSSFTCPAPEWKYPSAATRVTVQESTGDVVTFLGQPKDDYFTFHSTVQPSKEGAGKPQTQAPHVKSMSVSAVKPSSVVLSSSFKDSDLKASAKASGAGADPMSRDEGVIRQELEAEVEFGVVRNDAPGSTSYVGGAINPNDWPLLIAMQRIFQTQLPRMPKDYVCRLVLDRRHRNLMIMKNQVPFGGICFRPFYNQGFAEIVFCAISSHQQVRGYGTRVMNHLKEHCRRAQIYYFLTYADNYAIGYFKKQGFTKHITFPRNRWEGWIKDYEGGTLMECCIDKDINYLTVPALVKRQKEAILVKTKGIALSHVIYKGLNFAKEPVQDVMNVPGFKEGGYIPPKRQLMIRGQVYRTNSDKEFREELHKALRDVLERIKRHPEAWPYLEAVDPKEVEDYYEVIKNPIDLAHMERQLDKGTFYRTKEIFAADLKRMVDNSKQYNADNLEYKKTAIELEKFYRPLMEEIEVIKEDPRGAEPMALV